MDIIIAVPSLPILILISALLGGKNSLVIIAVVLVIFNWPWPGRQARAMSLSLREREFISVAQASGESTLKIVVVEIMPFVLGWALANFINTILVAISAESGLAIIGLSSLKDATLGTMIYWAMQHQALLSGKVALDSVADLCDHVAFYWSFSGFHGLVRLLCNEKGPAMIRIKHVSLFYKTVQGTVKAVEDVSFDIFDGEISALPANLVAASPP